MLIIYCFEKLSELYFLYDIIRLTTTAFKCFFKPLWENSEPHKLAALRFKLNFGCSWAYKLELEAQVFWWKRGSRFALSSAYFKLILKILSKMDFSQNFKKNFNLNLTHKLLFGTVWANPIQIQQTITEFTLKLSLFK